MGETPMRKENKHMAGKRKRSLKALKAYMEHNGGRKLMMKEEILDMKKTDDDGLTELCFDAEDECKRLGISY
jgi:hypothetical protein